MTTHLRTALQLCLGAVEIKDEDKAKDVETKALGILEIKDEEKGEVEAIIATLGVVDKDGDVITQDAIKSGAKVTMSDYAHNIVFGGRPVGKGTLEIDGNKAVFRGRMFLKTADGRDCFELLKEMGSEQQWSFGYRVMGSEIPDETWKKKGAYRILTKLDAFEVSPVIRGAGVGTRTVGVKEEKPPEPAPEPEPTPTPEELEAKAKAEADAKAALDRAEAERKARGREAVDDMRRSRDRLKRLGYVR